MRDHAEKAIRKEMQLMIDLAVFTPITTPEAATLKKPIPSSMFLKEKYDSRGEFIKLKARFVAGGHKQDKSLLLYEEITSPTAPMPLILAVAAIAASEGRQVITVDVPGA
jgi:hypothetical protein